MRQTTTLCTFASTFASLGIISFPTKAQMQLQPIWPCCNIFLFSTVCTPIFNCSSNIQHGIWLGSGSRVCGSVLSFLYFGILPLLVFLSPGINHRTQASSLPCSFWIACFFQTRLRSWPEYSIGNDPVFPRGVLSGVTGDPPAFIIVGSPWQYNHTQSTEKGFSTLDPIPGQKFPLILLWFLYS